jgi:sulfite reductase (ferredoxin)
MAVRTGSPSRPFPRRIFRSGESFKDFTKRIGKAELKKMLDDLTRPPAGERSYFSDWGDPREYSLGDMGVGECAGEVVSPFDFEMGAAERELFEGQLALEAGEIEPAGSKAYRAMLRAARALVLIQLPHVSDAPDQIVAEFRKRFFDTQLFWDPFAGGKFASYFFDAHAKANQPYTADSSRYLLDEAQLFIDAAHSCNNKLMTAVAV